MENKIKKAFENQKVKRYFEEFIDTLLFEIVADSTGRIILTPDDLAKIQQEGLKHLNNNLTNYQSLVDVYSKEIESTVVK